MKKLFIGMILAASSFIQGMKPAANSQTQAYCSHPGTQFIKISGAPVAWKNQLNQEIWKCPNGCQTLFNNRRRATFHAKSSGCPKYPNKVLYKCPMGCGKEFSRQENANEHARTACPNQQNPKFYKCSNKGCEKEFTRQEITNRHAKTTCPYRPNPTLYKCPRGCEKEFTSQKSAQNHFKSTECPKFRTQVFYKCSNDGCNENFTTKQTARQHAASIACKFQENPTFHKCPMCGKKTTSKSTAMKHRRTAACQNRVKKRQAESVPVATPNYPAAADAGPADTDLSIPAIEYLCPVCDMPLPDKNSYCANGICSNSLLPDLSDDRRSAKRHHPDTTDSSHTNRYVCPRCEMTFSNEESFEEHYFNGDCTV